jgi:hypothetical protein
MGIFNIFKRKPILSPEQEKEAIAAKEAFDNREIRGYCGQCEKIIEIGEPWTKQLGKHYHRACWKMVRKEGWG